MISSTSNKEDETARAILYKFWDSLPKIAFIEAPKDIVSSHPCRSTILKILREGVQEIDRITKDKTKIRHALNVEELRRILSKHYKIKISKTGMYFHLKKLENAGLIILVSKILEGRHKIAYFGRSAHHLFVRDPETRRHTYDRRFGQLEKLTQVLLPRTKVSIFKGLSKKFHKIKREREQVLGDWLVKNEQTIRRQNLEISELFEVLKIVDWVNPQYVSLLRKINQALKIDSNA